MSGQRLHITNGDGAAGLIDASTVCGDVLPWRDPMHHGPFPDGLDLDAVGRVRADYLAHPGSDREDTRRSFAARNEQLYRASRYDEVVLWFEHDLLDQLQILEILNWFNDADIGTTQLSMICIDAFPGVERFRGIGVLNSDQTGSLFSTRTAITAEQLDLARRAWAAFRSSDPTELQRIASSTQNDLPFLPAALRRHLEEFPWTTDGLTRTERQILRLIESGVSAPGRVFAKNMDFEDALYIGDWTTYARIDKLCSANPALVSCDNGARFRYPPLDVISNDTFSFDDFRAQRLEVTPEGRNVLGGVQRYRARRDEWLGGLHVETGRPMWMWDPFAGNLVRQVAS